MGEPVSEDVIGEGKVPEFMRKCRACDHIRLGHIGGEACHHSWCRCPSFDAQERDPTRYSYA